MRLYEETIKALRDPHMRPAVLVSGFAIAGVTVVGSVAILAVAAVKIWACH